MIKKIISRLMGINRLWLLSALAILLALISTFLSSSYLQSRERSISEDLKRQISGGPMVEVLVSSANLPAGAVLGDTLVKREVPADLVEEDTLTPADYERIYGAKLTRALRAGYPLNPSFIIEKSKSFSDSVEPGMRAITIEVDEINSMAQMVKPGNRVDLMLITPDKSDPEGSGIEVIMVLQNVKVMATGQSVSSREGDSRSRGQVVPAANQQSYTNFTFEVSPQDAAVIALAQSTGKIRAVLRKVGDNEVVMLKDINSRRLLQVEEKNALRRKFAASMAMQDMNVAESLNRASAANGGIEFIIGGGGGTGQAIGSQPQALLPDAAAARSAEARPATGSMRMDRLQSAVSDALKGTGVPADAAGLPSTRNTK